MLKFLNQIFKLGGILTCAVFRDQIFSQITSHLVPFSFLLTDHAYSISSLFLKLILTSDLNSSANSIADSTLSVKRDSRWIDDMDVRVCERFLGWSSVSVRGFTEIITWWFCVYFHSFQWAKTKRQTSQICRRKKKSSLFLNFRIQSAISLVSRNIKPKVAMQN